MSGEGETVGFSPFQQTERSELAWASRVLNNLYPSGLQATTVLIPAVAHCRYGAPLCTDMYG